jgi:hypothetical protein
MSVQGMSFTYVDRDRIHVTQIRTCEGLLLLLVVVIRARSQGSGCTAAIRLIVYPVF